MGRIVGLVIKKKPATRATKATEATEVKTTDDVKKDFEND